MNVQSQIPAWLQWAWAIAGLGIAAGGLVWIIGIFWPYLRWSKNTMLVSLGLAERTAAILQELDGEIRPLIDRARAVLDDADRILRRFDQERHADRILESLERVADLLAPATPDPEDDGEAAAVRARIEERIADRSARRKRHGPR